MVAMIWEEPCLRFDRQAGTRNWIVYWQIDGGPSLFWRAVCLSCPVRSYLQSQALRPILSRYRATIHTRSCTDAEALRFLTRIRSLMCRSMPRRAIGAVVHIVQLLIEVLPFDKTSQTVVAQDSKLFSSMRDFDRGPSVLCFSFAACA